jgi:hypothetical protein
MNKRWRSADSRLASACVTVDHAIGWRLTHLQVERNPWLGATASRSPFSLSSTEFVEPPPKKKSFWVRHCWILLPLFSYCQSQHLKYMEITISFRVKALVWKIVRLSLCSTSGMKDHYLPAIRRGFPSVFSATLRTCRPSSLLPTSGRVRFSWQSPT